MFSNMLMSNGAAAAMEPGPVDLTNISYTGNSLDLSTQLGSASGLHFKEDGTAFYASDRFDVFEYTLSTPWDLSTASYSGNSSGVISGDVGLTVTADGLHMYTADVGDDEANQYDMSTAFDVSTLSFADNESTTLEPRSVFVHPEGERLYQGERRGSEAVLAWTMTTPYDVTTLSYDGQLSVSGEVTAATPSMFFTLSGDGSTIILCDGEVLLQYTMSTPYDITTAAYDSISADLSSQVSDTAGIAVSPDGTKLYVVGIDEVVYEYDL